MQKQKFIDTFDKAIETLIDFTKEFCTNTLADNYLFLITPSGSKPHSDLDEYEVKNLKTLNKYSDKPLTKEQVIDLLWHDNKVPLWIDTTVYESLPKVTIIELICSRRLRSEAELNHKVDKYPPFHILVSNPPNSDLEGERKKFDINWKKEWDEKLKPKSTFDKLKRFFNLS